MSDNYCPSPSLNGKSFDNYRYIFRVLLKVIGDTGALDKIPKENVIELGQNTI